MNIDHSKSSFPEAVGFKEKDLNDLQDKTSDIFKDYVRKHSKMSIVTEQLRDTLSYDELLLIATIYITEKADEMHNTVKKITDIIIQKITDEDNASE